MAKYQAVIKLILECPPGHVDSLTKDIDSMVREQLVIDNDFGPVDETVIVNDITVSVEQKEA